MTVCTDPDTSCPLLCTSKAPVAPPLRDSHCATLPTAQDFQRCNKLQLCLAQLHGGCTLELQVTAKQKRARWRDNTS